MEGNRTNDLKKKIILRIDRVERRRLMAKAAGFAAACGASLTFATFAYFEVMAEASRSGLWSFVSLLFSDFSSAIANFSDFALSIVESFPIFSTALLLCGIFFAIWSAARFANEIALLRGHKIKLS
jgi:hypothetical protein